MDHPVRRRAIFFVGGYDPKTPEAFFGRLQRELARFETLWGLKSAVSPVAVSSDGEIGTVTLKTEGGDPAWAVTSDFNFFVLDKIVLADFARPLPVRLGKYLVAFADFVFSGTALQILFKGMAVRDLFPVSVSHGAAFPADRRARCPADCTLAWLGQCRAGDCRVRRRAVNSWQALAGKSSDGSVVVLPEFYAGWPAGRRSAHAALRRGDRDAIQGRRLRRDHTGRPQHGRPVDPRHCRALPAHRSRIFRPRRSCRGADARIDGAESRLPPGGEDLPAGRPGAGR